MTGVQTCALPISFFAGKVEDEEKKFDIQKLAGQLLEPMAKVVDKRN